MAARSLHARTAARHVPPATPWQQALESRQRLEAMPIDARTRAGYTRVLDRFRAIYHDNPRDPHAAEAINTVAELLAEQGRSLDDARSLQAAIGQYEFLRTQYPGSSLRAPALLEEGKLEAEDLHDAAAAREKFALVLKLYPHTSVATEARAELAKIAHGRVATEPAVAHSEAPVKAGPLPLRLTDEDARNLERDRTLPGPAPAPVQPLPSASGPAVPVESKRVATVATTAPAGPLAQVTGIRHWSTSTYTRVAIDLGDAVTFEAARAPSPDRIYFDLHGAKLAPELVGKSFAVTDDGFLKRIRAAQAAGDVTRVVLDVNEVTEYSAFLLPNPYRLIIDIHGAKTVPGDVAMTPASQTEVRQETTDASEHVVPANAGWKASAAANTSGLPPMPVTDGGAAVIPPEPNGESMLPQRTQAALAKVPAAPVPRVGAVSRSTPARPVPNTVAERAATTVNEVAAVSEVPGRVAATTAPTAKPVAAVVPGSRSMPASAASSADAAPAKPAARTADGETSLIRALGLRINRIVIDAGHGGHDSGTLGVDGIEEKDVVLDVALRLGRMLHDRLGAEIIYTRSDDTFIPLETRTAIANKAQADLFLSIHANSSSDETARGVETYYLNFTSDPTALDVAARENAVSGQSIHQLSDLVKKITLKDKIAESREFASDVEGSLFTGLERGNPGLRNRGVKKAPFVVLIGANMPSILAEISFVTNRQDASQLRQPEYRQRVAESLFNGVAKYESSLGGGKPVPLTRASAR
jgi:N-acetylmuramoyl-L-alanine amidase